MSHACWQWYSYIHCVIRVAWERNRFLKLAQRVISNFVIFDTMQTNVCLFHIRMIIAGKIVMFSPTAVKQALQYLLWINGVQFLLICVCVHFVKAPCTPLAFHTCVFKCNILNLLVPPQCFMVNSPLDMKAFITWFANYSPLKFFISSTLCSVN